MSNEKYKNLLKKSSIGVLRLNYDGFIIDADRNAAEIIGVKLKDTPYNDITNIKDMLHAKKDQWDCIIKKIKKNNVLLKEEVKLSSPLRGTIWVEISGFSDFDDHGHSWFEALVSDITNRKAQEEKLYNMATMDSLTGIPSRILWMDRLEQSIRHCKRYGGYFGVLYLDLDGFKKINDLYGHQAGDLLLKEVAERIQEQIRKSDTLARIGGDEFALMVNNIKDTRNLHKLARSILESINKPFILDNATIYLGISVGICIYDEHSNTSDKIMNRADAAMYQAKRLGGNRFVVYDPIQDSGRKDKPSVASTH